MTPVITADPRIEGARQILAECGDEADWPGDEEARAALTFARGQLAAALGDYAERQGECMPPYPGDVEEALDAAADIVQDEAARLEKLHRRHCTGGRRAS